ncbi:MAG: DUF3696 domain-containing protein [Sphingomonadales bacterium]|nr:DUF3696 domain-containing protein [Sphingomonadales bacterium]
MNINMPQYSKLSLRNFRGFNKSGHIQLAPLTFLVGPNSSGKSSISAALAFMGQNYFFPILGNFIRRDLLWSGDLIDLGSFKDVVYKHSTSRTISISIESLNKKYPIEFEFEIKSNANKPNGFIKSINIKDVTSDSTFHINYGHKVKGEMQCFIDGIEVKVGYSKKIIAYHNFWQLFYLVSERIDKVINENPVMFKGKKTGWKRIVGTLASNLHGHSFGRMSRVSSGRGGPARFYRNTPPQTSLRFPSIRGGSRLYDSLSPEQLKGTKNSKSTINGKPFDEEVKNILEDMDIGSSLDVNNISEYHSAVYIYDNIIGVNNNLKDVGYGASQMLPVISACLTIQNRLLIVEQPEIHLHPKAQGVLADVICKTSKSKQVVVETHSPRFINKARIAIAEGDLSPEDVSIVYVSKNKNGSKVSHIKIDNNGEFVGQWPEGFFDQRYEDTMSLLRLKNNKNKQNLTKKKS